MIPFLLPQPTSGDVVELILADHRTFEDLLRECRRDDRDRDAARHALAELLVAHAEAEETEVYPTLRSQRARVCLAGAGRCTPGQGRPREDPPPGAGA